MSVATIPCEASEHTAQTAPQRDAVVSGRVFDARYDSAADLFATFACAAPEHALDMWFGPLRAAALAANPEALRGALDRDIAAIDAMISKQLDTVLHAPRFRRLEGSWRGVAFLAGGLDPAGRVKLRLLNIGWPEVCRDLERAIEFDQSQLFRRVYEDEFGMPGGEPFGLLIFDHEVRHWPSKARPTDDVAAIEGLSGVAAAAFAVVVLAASPALLEVDEFSDLAMTADVTAPLRGPMHTRWRSLASREDMRFVCITLPRVLARPTWEDDPSRADGFRYQEYAPLAQDRVWMSAAYSFAAIVARAFVEYAWPADIRGVDTDREGGGIVTHLPVESFRTDPPMVWTRPPLDLVLHDAQERSLVEAGLIPLTALPFSPDAAFAAVTSLQRPRRHMGATGEVADANARISARINAILCASRFAHYIKVLGRDMVGSVQTADGVERQLQSWLNTYVNATINAGADTRARFPLSAGRVTVREHPGRPGVFGCTIQLQPHYQLDDLAATFQLVTELSAPGRRE